jgi:hypothetical protein
MPENHSPSQGPAAVGQLHAYGWGVRTALRDNATAYGFSISITAAYGLASAVKGPGGAGETVLFALGAAGAFVLVSVSFLGRFHRTPLNEGDQVLTLSGGFDFLSVAVTVAVAYGLARLPEPWAFPVTGLGTVTAYLLVAGLDVVLARVLAKHTSFGRPREERASG